MLLSHGMTIGLPYWDLTLDSYVEDPFWSTMWTDALMGTARGVVKQGPFTDFPVTEGCRMDPDRGFNGSDTLERLFGEPEETVDAMYGDDDIEFINSRTR